MQGNARRSARGRAIDWGVRGRDLSLRASDADHGSLLARIVVSNVSSVRRGTKPVDALDAASSR